MPHNPNCDGDKCTKGKGEVRVLPSGGDSNLILCWYCFYWEMDFRRERNNDLAKDCQFRIPQWTDLKVYDGN